MFNTRRHIFILIFSLLSWTENILYEYDGWLIRGAKYAAIMNFRVTASATLQMCNSPTSLSPDGILVKIQKMPSLP
jgi:hypothetical protein